MPGIPIKLTCFEFGTPFASWHTVRNQLLGSVENSAGKSSSVVRMVLTAAEISERNGAQMNRALMTAVGLGLSSYLSLSTAAAGDGIFGPRPAVQRSGAVPVRTMFGLPVPQQWTGQRPVMGGAAENGAACRNGLCPAPQPGISRQATGVAGRSNGGNCPGGVCPIPQTNRRVPPATDQGWSGPLTRSLPAATGPRRTQPADPFRPAARTRIDDDSWFNRPVAAPLRDAFGSDYSSRELDLRRDYFSGGREEDRRREREPSSGRSMEVPVERDRGTIRI